MKIEPEYLGDAVYVQVDRDGQVWLSTGSHLFHEASNSIALEPVVLAKFISWLEMLRIEIESDTAMRNSI